MYGRFGETSEKLLKKKIIEVAEVDVIRVIIVASFRRHGAM